MSEKIVLIDGHSILNRAFYGLPDLTNAQGTHTNAMYGFLNIMFKIIDEENPDFIAVAFDLPAPTFRHKMFDGYKGTRKPAPDEFRQQVPLMKQVLKAMGIVTMELEGYEADDLLGTVAKRSEAKGLTVSVVSGDRDLLQLATDNIKIRIPKTKMSGTIIEDYNTKEVIDLYGVTPSEFIDVKALMGDTSDNIPGAPGIGEKTATEIISQFHTLENVYEHIDEITKAKARNSLIDNKEQVMMSQTLARIDINAPVEFDYEAARIKDFYTPEAYELFKLYNFKSHLKKFDGKEVKLQVKEIQYESISDFAEVENIFAAAEKQNIVGISLIDEDKSLYCVGISFGEKNYAIMVSGFVTEGYLIDKISKLAKCVKLSDSDDHTGYVGENKIVINDLKSKLYLLERFDESSFVDVALGAYLLNPLQEKYGYDYLASTFELGTLQSYEEIMGKASVREAAFVGDDKLSKVAAYDASVSLMTFEIVEKALKDQGMIDLYYDCELPLCYILYSMEYEGVLVRRDELKHYGDELAEMIVKLEQEIYDECGEQFNINSPKQLGVILFEKLGLPYGKKTKSGYSTAADVLEKIQSEYPIVRKILDYRQVSKLKSTYADGLDGYISHDGRIHGKFNQMVTATGRLSSAEPNLQNIPIRMELGMKIRKVFVAKDDCILIDADYSQIELRILSSMSKDEKLCEAYRSCEDIHRITASQVFHVPLDEVTKQMRSNAKAVNFGIIYGISSFGLSQDLNIGKKEAGDYIKKYFETYPTIERYIDSLVADAKENGYAVTMFGRRRPIPELKSSNFMQRSFGERIAMNSPIQGTAADIMKIAMIKVYNGLKRAKLNSRVIIQVHDEILIEAYKSEKEKVEAVVREAMTSAANLLVPLEIDMKSGQTWLEAH